MLEIFNLYVEIEKKKVVKGVSLTIKPGKVHILMGPNGSGKSSLAYALMGKREYKIKNTNKNSKIILNEKSISELEPDERARLGLFLAFQSPVAVPGVSVANFLITVYRNIKEQRAKSKNTRLPQDYGEQANQKSKSILQINQNLEEKCIELGIKKDFLRRSLNDGFSGGEKKKMEMLQMIVLKPKYAVVDEIDTGLDIDALKIVARGVKKLAQYGTGILLITHYQRILKHLKPDFVHVMVGGKIVRSGKAELAREIERKGYKNLKFEIRNTKHETISKF